HSPLFEQTLDVADCLAPRRVVVGVVSEREVLVVHRVAHAARRILRTWAYGHGLRVDEDVSWSSHLSPLALSILYHLLVLARELPESAVHLLHDCPSTNCSESLAEASHDGCS